MRRIGHEGNVAAASHVDEVVDGDVNVLPWPRGEQ
jgi:hypothetical protein